MELQEESFQRNTFQDQYSPFGSSTWQQGPDGRWTQTSVYSDTVQPMFDEAARRTMEGYDDVDPFKYRPAGLSSLIQNQMARMGDRGGIDLRPEMARSALREELERRMDDPRAGPPDTGGDTGISPPGSTRPVYTRPVYERPKRRRI